VLPAAELRREEAALRRPTATAAEAEEEGAEAEAAAEAAAALGADMKARRLSSDSAGSSGGGASRVELPEPPMLRDAVREASASTSAEEGLALAWDSCGGEGLS
jgi:hypothetical protein